MKHSLTIAVFLLFAGTSCITQKKCLERFPPQSTIITKVQYRDTIIPVYIPMIDTVFRQTTIRDTLRIVVGSAGATSWVVHDTLKMIVWQSDTTIQVKLDSAIQIIDTREKEIHVLREKYVPKIYKDALGICIFLFTVFAIWLGFKIRKIFVPR